MPRKHIVTPDIERFIAAAMYEGYALFPYRHDALKNQKRFNFGVLTPPSWADAQVNERSSQRIEVLFRGSDSTTMMCSIRCLRMITANDNEEIVERRFEAEIGPGMPSEHRFEFDGVHGRLSASIVPRSKDIYLLSVSIKNSTRFNGPETCSREEILPVSLLAVHSVFSSEEAEFFSAADPPDNIRALSVDLDNQGVFPVLMGEPSRSDCFLASPLIFEDHPQIAPSSLGDLFDGLEIDELLVLNILALPDDEKIRIAKTDSRTREIIDRISSASPEDLMQLHSRMTFR